MNKRLVNEIKRVKISHTAKGYTDISAGYKAYKSESCVYREVEVSSVLRAPSRMMRP